MYSIKSDACPKIDRVHRIGSVTTEQVFEYHLRAKKVTMKPLQTAQRGLAWIGIEFPDGGSAGGQQKLAKKLVSSSFAMVFIGICSLHVITFVNLDLIDAEEFFFVLLQLVMAAYGLTAFITIYFCGSHIPTACENLTKIYEKCKQSRSWFQFCFR